MRLRAAGAGSARRPGFSSFSPSRPFPNSVLPLAHHAEIPIVTGNVVVRREGSFNVAIHRRPSPNHHVGCADESLITRRPIRPTRRAIRPPRRPIRPTRRGKRPSPPAIRPTRRVMRPSRRPIRPTRRAKRLACSYKRHPAGAIRPTRRVMRPSRGTMSITAVASHITRGDSRLARRVGHITRRDGRLIQ